MALNSSSFEINLSKRETGFPYYQEQLNAFWIEVKRSAVYESAVFHGVNCGCCERIRNPVLAISNRKKKPKEIIKEVHRE
jgi:hypothetical protein